MTALVGSGRYPPRRGGGHKEFSDVRHVRWRVLTTPGAVVSSESEVSVKAGRVEEDSEVCSKVC